MCLLRITKVLVRCEQNTNILANNKKMMINQSNRICLLLSLSLLQDTLIFHYKSQNYPKFQIYFKRTSFHYGLKKHPFLVL